MNTKIHVCKICQFLIAFFDILLRLWSYALSRVVTGCSSPHGKECQPQPNFLYNAVLLDKRPL